jgi:hypothetical protein
LNYLDPVTIIDDMGGVSGPGYNVEIDLHRHTLPANAERIQQAGNRAAITDFFLFSIELDIHVIPPENKKTAKAACE